MISSIVQRMLPGHGIRRYLFLAAVFVELALIVGGVAACGDDDEEATPTPGVTEGSPAPSGGEVAVELSADNTQFDTETITVPAGAHVVVQFTNEEAVPHNFAAYESEDAEEEIFVGDTITGPDETVTYEFDAPEEPGTYFFRCDVHPVQMTGDFVVE